MSVYDLESIKLPKLTGFSLKIFTALVENPITRNALLPELLKNGGIPYLRQLTPTEPPTYYPISFSQNGESAIPFTGDGIKPSHFPNKSIRDYALAFRSGEMTPLDVAEKVLESIHQSQVPEIEMNLFIAVDRENMLAQAASSTERFKRNQPLSILDGIPLAVKDEIDMLPYPTTVGTRFLGKSPASEDSTISARLRAGGATMVGKTNMHEIGINPNGYNDTYGAVKNPYNLTCDPGGSSSGSAAVVACGIVPSAIGADGGGSIRIPASLCGVVGLKATYGRISEFGAFPLCWSVAHAGPLANTVEDTALIYSVIAGPDPRDPNTLHQPTVSLKDWNKPDLHGVTAGIYPEWFDHADPEVVAANREMLQKLQSRGLVVKEISIPGLNAIRIAHAATILTEMAHTMSRYKSMRSQHGSAVRLTLVIGEVLTAMDYTQAQRIRSQALHNFEQIFSQVDIILTPATARSAQPVPQGGYQFGWSDLSLDTEMMRYATPGNFLGLPAISFPCGYDSRGMPIGMQSMGKHWNEALLLRVAYNAEQEFTRKLPPVFFG